MNIRNARGPTYQIDNVEECHDANYSCVVSSPTRCKCIKRNTTSNSARLTVSELCLSQPFWGLSLQCRSLAIHAVMQTCMCACVHADVCVCVCVLDVA